MGIYINPRSVSKENWLKAHGRQLATAPDKFREGDDYAVILVDNGPFRAAGVCFSQSELDEFKYPDQRPKTWYMVPRSSLEAELREFELHMLQ